MQKKPTHTLKSTIDISIRFWTVRFRMCVIPHLHCVHNGFIQGYIMNCPINTINLHAKCCCQEQKTGELMSGTGAVRERAA